MSDSFNILVSQDVLIHIPMALVLVVGSYLAWTRRNQQHPC
jgi:hypothetical protein